MKQHKFGTYGKVMWLEHRQDWQEGDEAWNGRHGRDYVGPYSF